MRGLDMKTLIGELEGLKENLEDTNSLYPATQEFLRLKGVKNVRELDETGKRELTEFLRAELARLTGKASGA
jgi:hypothetical protein